MKHLCFFCLFFIYAFLNSFAQDWTEIDQSYYNMIYKLPSDWWVDGFGADNDWDAYGSSVCECAGTINGSDSLGIKMVVYPSLKSGVDSPKRQIIWDFKFIPSGKTDVIKTKYFSWERDISRFETVYEGENQYQGYEVWQLKANTGKYYYFMYFWGKPGSMKQNEKLLKEIIESFHPAKKR